MPRETTEECKARWTAAFQPLVGRTIKSVSYMSEAEVRNTEWDRSPLMVELDDGTLLYASADDEGNDAGAMFLAPSDAMKALNVPDVAPVIG